MSLRRRLFFSIVILVGISFSMISRWIRSELLQSYSQLVEESLVDSANLMASIVEEKGMKPETFEFLKNSLDQYQNKSVTAKIFEFTKNKPTLNIYLVDSTGLVVFASDASLLGQDFSKWNDVVKSLRGDYGARSTRTDSQNPRSSVYYVASPIRQEGKIIGSLTVYKAEDSIIILTDQALQKLFYGGLFSVFIVILFGALILLWITYPLERLRQYAVNLSEGKKVSLPRSSIKEIRHLGEAFEKMRISLEGKKTIERYIQVLTHELKSPLTAIHGAAELSLETMDNQTREKFLKNILHESKRSHQLLEKLLKISELESRSMLEKREVIDLLTVIEEVKESLLGFWSPRSIQIIIMNKEEVQIQGDRFLVLQSIKNVVQNAIEFSPDHSQVQIQINKYKNEVDICIIDQGIGVPNYAKEKIFEKFYSLERPQTKEKSTGLGLSFVKEVMSLHQGKLSFESSPDVSGKMKTIFTLRFPTDPV